MNNKNHQEYIKAVVKPKFHGSQSIKSKVAPRYPASAERELQRISWQYLNIFCGTLKEHLPAIMAAYKKERHGTTRYDDTQSLNNDLKEEMKNVSKETEQKAAMFGLIALIEKVAEQLRKSSVKDWSRIIKQTLGIDLADEYYSKEMYEHIIRQWIAENVSKIKSIPSQTLSNMERIILDGFMNGTSVRDIQNAIQNEYNVTKSKAVLIARDQIATLSARMSKMQQQDAGCKRYRWSSSKDSRVRDCHRELDGRIFSWDDPPEIYYYTQSRGKVMTGRRCHPGEDFCCRCVAIPIFDIDALDIPLKPK